MLPRFLIDRLEEALDCYVAVDPRALLFVGATGGPLRYSRFLQRVWRPAIAAPGLSGERRMT